MNELKDEITKGVVPRHIAMIMDGNGRWAKSRGKARIFGHKNGVQSVRDVTEACAELGVSYLTLYAFSTENWRRPKLEVSALMTLLVETLGKEIKTLDKNNIQLKAIGDLSRLPAKTRRALEDGIERTKDNSRMTLILALNYSGKWDVIQGMKQAWQAVEKGEKSIEDINEESFAQFLSTKNIPDPDLLIRTSGEYRLSNFLLWQLAYAELHFTPVMWPDFRKEMLYEAILSFQNRERRFGKTGEQLSNESE